MCFTTMKKAQSMKSVRSTKSMKSIRSGLDSFIEEKAMEFDECIVNAFQKFNCPYPVRVVKETQRDDFYKTLKKTAGPPVKYKKITVAASNQQMAIPESDIKFAGLDAEASKQEIESDAVVVTALYDNMKHLVELSLTKVRDLPRVVMQVLGILVPYFRQLNKISLTRCKIDKYTIHELNKALSLSSITEVCLDDSPLPEANYAILLDGNSCLRSLSLSRCRINDNVFKQIVSRLHFLEQSEASLGVLNLSSNQITDDGVKYIGEALRTNRHLRYLNLADNGITDEGAGHILNVLMEFPLTYEEVSEKRHRYSDYLRTRQALYDKYLNEFDSKSVDEYSNVSKRSAAKKKEKGKPVIPLKNKGSIRREPSCTDDYLSMRAELMAGEEIGPYVDPFGPSCVKLKDGHSHCIGNFTLCYLNISYNNLSYLSVKKLLNIVRYQHLNKMKSGQVGLIKVMLDGNNMPETCAEIVNLNELLQSNINCFGRRSTVASSRRKSTRITSPYSTDKSAV